MLSLFKILRKYWKFFTRAKIHNGLASVRINQISKNPIYKIAQKVILIQIIIDKTVLTVHISPCLVSLFLFSIYYYFI
jgi:hypothetical protein